MTTQCTRNSYSSLSHAYIEQLGHIDFVLAADRAFIAEAFEEVQSRILDAGCDPGHLTSYLRHLGHDVHGIDLVPEFVTHARQAYPSIDFTVGDITHIDEENQTLGGILAWYSLIHMSEETLTAALAEFRRVLIPGGILALGAFHAAQRTTFEHKVTPATAWPEDDLELLLDRAGFRAIRWEIRPASSKIRAHLAVAAVATSGHTCATASASRSR